MRALIFSALFSAAAFAQAPPQDEKAGTSDPPAAQARPSQEHTDANRRHLAELLSRRAQQSPKIVTAENVPPRHDQPCAIPLKNALGPRATPVGPMKTFPPPDPSRFPMREVAPPAPSCDDMKR